jgi:hypothetical protein
MWKLIYYLDGAAQLFSNAYSLNVAGFLFLTVVRAHATARYGPSSLCMLNDLNLLLAF